MPTIATFEQAAINAGLPFILHYRGKSTPTEMQKLRTAVDCTTVWRAANVPAGSDLECDEYPFAQSREGESVIRVYVPRPAQNNGFKVENSMECSHITGSPRVTYYLFS